MNSIFDNLKIKSRRIIALDLLRGLFLIVIFINHLAWSPSLYTFITGDSHLLASAAEGFFVISGILIGYIYGPKIISNTRATIIKLLKRAGWLYILSIFFTFLYSIIVLPLEPDYMRTYYVFSDTFTGVFDYIFKVLTLQFIFGWADFLARYAVFMLFAPLVLWLIAKGRGRLVLVASVLIWFIFSHALFAGNLFSGWVIIFFPSILIGYNLPHIESWFKHFYTRHVFAKPITHSIIAISAITYIMSSLATTIFPYLLNSRPEIFGELFHSVMITFVEVDTYLQQDLFNRDTMGIGRIAIGILWFSTLYLIFRKFETKINEKTNYNLYLFGTNSLYVYGWSSLIIILTDIILPPVEWRPLVLNTVVVSFMLGILYIVVKRRTSMQSNFTKIKQRWRGNEIT